MFLSSFGKKSKIDSIDIFPWHYYQPENTNNDSIDSFPWHLYPKNTDKSKINLMDPVEFTEEDWIVFERIEKCGTKTFSQIIPIEVHKKLNTPSSVCPPNNHFLATRYFGNIESCHLGFDCGSDIFYVKDKSKNLCQYIWAEHCDWSDLFSAFDAENENIHPIIIARDPVKRTISEYKQVYKHRGVAWDYCVNTVDGEEFTKENFINFLKDPRHSAGMRNRQTRMIAGCGSGISCEEKYSSEEEMLEAAKRNVLKSSLIGTLERLSEMLVTANYVFGWDIQEYDAVRGTTDFWVLDWDESDVQDIVLEYNNLDNILFEFIDSIIEIRSRELEKILGHSLPTTQCDDNTCRLIHENPSIKI